MKKNHFNLFLNSALTENNPFISTCEVETWLEYRNKSVHVQVEQIGFKDLTNWLFGGDKLKLHHTSGKFFSRSSSPDFR